MLRDIVDNVIQEISNATVVRDHPFRSFSLATVSADQLVRQRTVVLRSFKDDHRIIFYTDLRSQKVKEIRVHEQVSLLFYAPENQTQVSCQGHAIISIPPNLPPHFTSEKTLRDYSVVPMPGSRIEDPALIKYEFSDIHFAEIEIFLTRIEYLKLSREGHTRALFIRENRSWEGSFLVP